MVGGGGWIGLVVGWLVGGGKGIGCVVGCVVMGGRGAGWVVGGGGGGLNTGRVVGAFGGGKREAGPPRAPGAGAAWAAADAAVTEKRMPNAFAFIDLPHGWRLANRLLFNGGLERRGFFAVLFAGRSCQR